MRRKYQRPRNRKAVSPHVEPRTTYKNVIPTSHRDLFVGPDGRLIHRTIGQLSHNANHQIAMPDGATLKVYYGAPAMSVRLTSQPGILLGGDGNTGDVADIIALFTVFSEAAAPYLTAAAIALKVLDLLSQTIDDSDDKLANIEGKLSTILLAAGATDYLALLRLMANMRANATSIFQTLSGLTTLIDKGDASAWYKQQLIQRDAQLQTDINALLDPSEAYFRRVYVESLIAGDGNWLQVISDRPVDASGTTFEYRIALPTLLFLISVRLTMMKMVVPDFVSRGTFSAEIDNWWRRLEQISTRMGFFVKETPVTDLPVQCARRQTDGGQKLGEYVNWETHCSVPPPYSISPIGAVDITTGYGKIDWDYVQFDEWYLSRGNLHGRPAGYWPPSIGPNWYKPPVNATGLPDLTAAGQQYLFEARGRARSIASEVVEAIGAGSTSIFAWRLFDIAHPGVGTPI